MDHSKYCPKCKKWYVAATSFVRNRARRDGYTPYCKRCQNDINTAYVQGLRTQALDLLGGICAQCGFDDRRALAIDHIDGDGYRQRQGMAATRFYLDIIAGSHDGLQILCFNCNQIKKIENEEFGDRRVTVEEDLDHDPVPPPDGRFEGIGDRWARNFDRCLDCGRTDRRHAGFGYCATCYVRPKNQAVIQPQKWGTQTKGGRPRHSP